MTVEEMLKLIDAGFTAEELRAMKQERAKEQQAPAPEEKPKETPKEEKAPAPEEKPTADEKMEKMLNEIRDLKKAVFAFNVMNQEQPQPKSADDILANIMKGAR